MSGYEVPPPTNTDYFNTLFYYNSQGTAGGTVDPTTLLSYPTAQGLEYFPAGVDMGNAITFSNPSSSNNVIQNVGRLYFSGGTFQTVPYVSTAVGQLATANSWDGINTFNKAPSIPLGLTFTGGSQTVPYQANLVGQLSAGNVWSNTTTPNKFVAGIQFNDNTIQTTAATSTALLSSNNTWSGTNSFTQIPSTTVVTAPTNQQFVTFAYGNSIYPRLLTNNLYQGINTFNTIAATTCSCADFTSNTLTCSTSIDTPILSGTSTTVTTLTMNGTTKYGTSNFTTYYDTGNSLPTMVFTSPNYYSAGKSPQFVFTFPGLSQYVVINAGGLSVIGSQYTSSSQAQPANQVVQTDTDVIIRGISWNQTVSTLAYLKSFLFKEQIIPPP